MLHFRYHLSIVLLLFSTLPIVLSQSPTDTATLSNGVEFPLRGIGVGNLAHEDIGRIVRTAASDSSLLLIDTAHASRNEHIIEQALVGSTTSAHVVTKVWYTYLGYHRTQFSVNASLLALSPSVQHVHMLLHWPRCRDDIPWMDCAGEEAQLDASVRDGLDDPPPHLHKDTAFLASWEALEDMYQSTDRLASIGVSNFDVKDLKMLLAEAKVVPHLIQLNVWSVLFDTPLVQLCKDKKIQIQVYNVFGILNSHQKAPNAYHSLETIASSLSIPTVTQLVLDWLVTWHGVSIIPRTSRVEHVRSNTAAAAASVVDWQPETTAAITAATQALLRGVDLVPPHAVFASRHDEDVHVFWKQSNDGEEDALIPVKENLRPGDVFATNTHPGHVFVAVSGERRKEFTITAGYGDQEEIHIEL